MTYAIELWTEYGIGMFFFTIRFFARYKAVGFRGFAWDDLFSFIAMVEFSCYFYVLSADISVSCYGALMPSHFKSLVKSCESPAQDNTLTGFADTFGSFVGLNDQTAEALSDHTAARYKVGSQSLFCAWISYVSLIWALKASLLCFYSRITLGLWQLKLVKIMAYISFVAYIAVMLELFLHCTPIQKNWQIKPYPGDKCAVTVSSYVLCAILNVGSGRFKKFSGNNLSGVNGTQTMKGNRANDLETGGSRKGPQSIESEMELKDISYHGSEENIIDPRQHNSPLEINVTTAYALDNEEEDHSPTAAGAREGGRARRRHEGGKSGMNTDQWGSTTKVTAAGDRSERSNNKAMKMLGGGWS
ncbi:hypothetical protein LAWI1_G004358 [Lachnellula willkommii]|uniref:Rhodopsin domain-containing protein n=1 Tax=Lachnellula willkommii TaxID=215461 RepID=A0A559MG45_9HELO|nr:hypothetical protein LAWI1_G004358 [Lachnellula willkommii]